MVGSPIGLSSGNNSFSMTYRPEIDGLRAIAVIPVVLFHAGFEFCSGGFLGVDVFFVISGYLITSILVDELNQGSISLKQFYLRRIRRLIPGFLFMLLIVSFFFLLLVRPSQQESESLSNSVLSSLFFYSNFYFSLNNGYFASSSELTPLLHTWSLSVEEQFYLIYPILLLFGFKWKNKSLILLISFIFFSSLFLCFLGGELFGKWNFYLLLTRAWELAAGALCFLCKIKNFRKYPQYIFDSISLLGLILILGSFYFLDESINSPSLWCLFPVTGTILIIKFCRPQGFVCRFLSAKVLVLIGILSYGIYLWHHPLLSISRHFVIHPFYLDEKIVIFSILLTFLAAWISYFLIEKPFRSGAISLKWLLVPLALLLTLGFLPNEISKLGLNPRSKVFSDSVRDLARDDYDSDRTKNGYVFGDLSKTTNDILLLGDSHARMLMPGLTELMRLKKWKGFHPYEKKLKSNFLAIQPNTDESFLKEWRNQMELHSEGAKAIIISFRHSRSKDNYFYDPILPDLPQVFFDNFEKRVSYLSTLVSKLFIIAPFPESPTWGPNLGRSFFQHEKSFDTSVSRYLWLHQKLLKRLEKIENDETSIEVIYPHHFLRNENNHVSYFMKDDQNGLIPYYYDDDHLNRKGYDKILENVISNIQ
jgi:peptidoglycan/LPS O-acetylase OafA/YrhL